MSGKTSWMNLPRSDHIFLRTNVTFRKFRWCKFSDFIAKAVMGCGIEISAKGISTAVRRDACDALRQKVSWLLVSGRARQTQARDSRFFHASFWPHLGHRS